MYASCRLFHSIGVIVLIVASAVRAAAQEPHQHPPAAPAPQGVDHSQHEMPAQSMFVAREGSGTSWLPEVTPMYGIHRQAGDWQLMFHGNAFAQFLYDSGDRGADQGGSINWVMGMARRELGAGRFGLRGMLSLESWSIPGCGYPDLLATGETCGGSTIHDRQHPHDLVMEAAVDYERPLRGSLRWQVYGGLAGEPALGPVAFPHRISAMPNPLAPTSHHWLDATHITFGVVTAGLSSTRWNAEASIFNGREPDERRWDLDLGPLDSISGRVSYAPVPSIVLQVSGGHLAEAEPGHDGGRADVGRMTASATWHVRQDGGALWATTLAWGRNVEESDSTQALLVETSVALPRRGTWFGRFEVGGKAAHDLDVHGVDEIVTVAKAQLGYTRYFGARLGLQPGVGGTVSAGFVPTALEPVYGGRAIPGFGVFLTLRPAAHRM